MTATSAPAPERLVPSPLAALAAALEARGLYAPVSFGPLSAPWRPLSALWGDDDADLTRLLRMQGAYSPDLDAKGRSAYLASAYAYALARPVAEGLVGFGLVPDIDPDRLGYRLEPYVTHYLDREIALERVHLRFGSESFATDDPAGRGHPHARTLADRAALIGEARAGLERHMAPLVARLNALSRLPVAAMWRLIADGTAYAFLEAGRHAGCEDRAIDDALALLKHPGSPLANKELRFVEIALIDDAAAGAELIRKRFRARGGCCRYYTVEGGALCPTCVLRKPRELHETLAKEMREELGEAGRSARALVMAG
ncbi:(2Fe-2S)-binding protein [Methylopila musalis]|uniref:(2Fe-2S)-binding protein n=1 Tax=Methylopila musalis TaxID=1134781 RepID=A0ABW3Z5Z9_9HYPH